MRHFITLMLKYKIDLVKIYIFHHAKSMIHENNGLTIGEQKNTIQNFYNPLLAELRDMNKVQIKGEAR